MLQLDCSISPERDSIRLSLPDKNGRACEVVLTFDEASSLAISLPRLLTIALHRKYSDSTLRHVYPLRGYTVEGAPDFCHLLLALAAAEGFDVVFALNIETAAALARDLAGSGSLLAETTPILRN